MVSNFLETVWPEWQIEEQIGRGSFGVVYRAVRRDNNVESHAAIKVISIPSASSEVYSLRSEGMDVNAAKAYLQGIVNDFASEIQLMESLKGIQNIVSVEDYKVVEKADEVGWDIYIRMELLIPFNVYASDKELSEEEIVKLGCDICTALEICGKRNIIHRDIKPENIFINDFGYFKLGDFGIARKLENMTGGLSQKGTYNYMAPEVVNSTDYDARVDIYSLGIVLYRLLNGNRLPFLDIEKQLLSPNERLNAVERRLRGEALPAPRDASPAMANLILRACDADPNRRFPSATEMKHALMNIGNTTHQVKAVDQVKTTPVRHGPNKDNTTIVVRNVSAAAKESDIEHDLSNTERISAIGSRRKSIDGLRIAVCILMIVVGIGSIYIGYEKLKAEAVQTYIAQYEYGLQLVESDDLEAARQVLTEADAAMPGQIDGHVAFITALVNADEMEWCVSFAQEALADYPELAENAQFNYCHGIALEHQGDIEGAIDKYQAASEAEPDDVVYMRHLARAFAAAGDMEQANQLFERLKRVADDITSSFVYAGILEAQDKTESAVTEYQNCIDSSGDESIRLAAYQELAELYQQQREQNPTAVDSEIEALLAMQRAFPGQKEAFIWESLGEAYFAKGILSENEHDLRESLSCFQNLISIGHSRASTYLNIAIIQQRLMEYEEAEETLQLLLNRYPGHAEAYIQMAFLVAEREGKKAQSERDYYQVLRYHQLAVENGATGAELQRLEGLIADLRSAGWLS